MTAAEIRRNPEAKRRAIQCLWQLDRMPGGQRHPYLYAVLDAARDERIYPELRRLAATEEVLCLYQGQTANELATVAPYLVCLGITDRVFDWIWAEGWGESWGIFVWTLVSPERLRSHLRRLTVVQTESGRRMLFRFYDPRVLVPFAVTCSDEQLQELFGPIRVYGAEERDQLSIVQMEFGDSSAVGTKSLSLQKRLLVPPQ